MDVRFTFVLAAALVIWAGDPGPARSQGASQQDQDTAPSSGQQTASDAAKAPSVPTKTAKALQPESRLVLVRDVDGEFAKVVQAIPGGKKGYRVAVGKPIDSQKLRDALRLWGTAATPGDTVQITGLEFRTGEILVQINGGPKAHFHLRDHLQIGMGSGMAMTSDPNQRPPQKLGATLILAYGRPLPDMSPNELKNDLSIMLDFSKQHSAAVNWVDTLSPAFQEAMKDHRAVEGMDHEMVIAAMGRPDQKVREKDDTGRETEDWIYGTPPARTTFVTFSGDKVIRVEQFD
jgi:hypothetical protein